MSPPHTLYLIPLPVFPSLRLARSLCLTSCSLRRALSFSKSKGLCLWYLAVFLCCVLLGVSVSVYFTFFPGLSNFCTHLSGSLVVSAFLTPGLSIFSISLCVCISVAVCLGVSGISRLLSESLSPVRTLRSHAPDIPWEARSHLRVPATSPPARPFPVALIPHASPRREAQRTRQLPRPLLSGGGAGAAGFPHWPRRFSGVPAGLAPLSGLLLLDLSLAAAYACAESGSRPCPPRSSLSLELAPGLCLCRRFLSPVSLRCLLDLGPGLGLSCLWIVSVNGNALFQILRWDSGPRRKLYNNPSICMYVCAHSCCFIPSASCRAIVRL